MFELILMRSIKNVCVFLSIIASSFILIGCGGAGTSGIGDFNTMVVFSDGAGVANGKSSDGDEMIYIAPNIIADVNASNTYSGSVDPVPINDYPIVGVSNGYNIRQGTVTIEGFTANVLIAEKIGTGKASIAYISDNYSDAIATYSRSLNDFPVGRYHYNGIFSAGSRHSDFAEIGNLSMTVNFEKNTFTINGQTDNSSLTGTGFIDKSNGRISSGNLIFISPHNTNYSATTIGRFGDTNASNASGVFYTNDSNPDYAGAYSADN